MEELKEIQQKLEVPKGQYNDFGGFNYRSAEDILTKLKPLLKEYNCYLKMTDEIVNLGDRYYIKAKVELINPNGEKEVATALAREALSKKGMDEAQVTGSASSYARKYALGGLFALDDGVDDDKLRAEPTKKTAKKSTSKAKSSGDSYMAKRKPSSSQISYIKRLGGTVKEGMTMAEASKLIDQLNDKSK